MKKYLFIAIVAVAGMTLTSCEKYNEVPPQENKVGTEYQLPSPEPLTQEDRAVISAQEKEYNENAE